jgi:hypothetical protein
MNFLRRTSSEDGQALLIVVLVMVIALTVTLSLVSRSIVNLKTSVEQTNSQKAFEQQGPAENRFCGLVSPA